MLSLKEPPLFHRAEALSETQREHWKRWHNA
jgi:hypothetical protein